MNLTRRILGPATTALPAIAAIAFLALAVPVALGSQGTGQPAAAVSSTGPTGPTTGATGPAQTLSATLSACHEDTVAANRYAIFASQMTAVDGSRTMAVNFELQERSAGSGGFATVVAPGFDTWVSSQPGVGIYTYNHEVTALPAPAAFRVLVRARWLDRHHRVIRSEIRVSPVCVQQTISPDLTIVAPLVRSAGSAAGTTIYSVTVRNDGTVAAGPFDIAFSVSGVALPDAPVSGLAAGATQVVQFTGPRCTAGSTLIAAADPAGAIAEPANPNRTRTFACLR